MNRTPDARAVRPLCLPACIFFLLCCGAAASAQSPTTYYELVARHSGKCLDVADALSADGAALAQWPCTGGLHQQWQVTDLGGGYSRLAARHSGKALDVFDASAADGARAIQWEPHAGTNQQWQLADAGGGYRTLVARHSGKCLDVNGGSAADGSEAIQWACHGGANQQWLLRPVAVPPDQFGAWSAVSTWPLIAIHTHLLPNRKILAWNANYAGGQAEVTLWDPNSPNVFTPVPVPSNRPNANNIFCTGHAFLPDGRLLISGGHIDNGVGLPFTNIYDFSTGAFTQLGAASDMNQGRWYPTNTTLPNGEVLVVSGDVTGGNVNRLPQVWQTNAGGNWRSLTTASEFSLPLYPWMHVAPNGRVFNSGPDQVTRFLNTAGTGAWTAGPTSNFGYRDYGTSVMYDSGKVLILGGGQPTNTAEVIDLNAAAPAWRYVRPMAFARRQVNATVLPDGKVLVTGGTRAPGFNNEAEPVYPAELWDPEAGGDGLGRWTTLTSMQMRRLYHSTAVLLPDGRVLSAGGGQGAGAFYNNSNAELYSPPYLFKGARPTVSSAPANVTYGQRFTVGTPQAAAVTRVTWVRLSSVTHSFNQDQRFSRLTFTRTTNALSVSAPSNRNLSPPGYYMLFILNGNGVPSIARVVRIS